MLNVFTNDPILVIGLLDGEVRRCASRSECEAEEHPLVDRECCDKDLCN